MAEQPNPNVTPRHRSALAKFIAAPESGLAFVILIMGTVLSVWGAGKGQGFWDEPLPAGAKTGIEQGSLVVRTDDQAFVAKVRKRLPEDKDGGLVVDDGQKKTSHKVTGRPRVIDGENGGPATLKVGISRNKFLNIDNLTIVANTASYIAIMAVGMTMIIAMGGIDLSVGFIWGISAYFGAFVLRHPWKANAEAGAAGGPPSFALFGSSGLFWLMAGLAAAALTLGLTSGRRARGTGDMRLAKLSTLSMAAGGLAGALAAIGVLFSFAAVALADPTRTPDAMPWWTSIPLGVGACMLVGAICGLINGSLIVGLRVHPFIITLGMMTILQGLVVVLTKGQSLTGMPDSYGKGFFKAKIAGVNPVPVFVMVGVAILGTLLMKRTIFGRRALAIGDNEKAATYAGIPVDRAKILVYTFCGALCGLSAAVLLGYWEGVSTGSGMGYELQVIAACVIGGASLSGGRGSALGAVLGALLVQLIENGMIILDIDQNYNKLVMGAAIVIAVVIDQSKSRMTRR